MKKGILYMRDRHMCFIINPFAREENETLPAQLVGKRIVVTFETTLYYFKVEQAWYENEELHVSAKHNLVNVISMLDDKWQFQLLEYSEPYSQTLIDKPEESQP